MMIMIAWCSYCLVFFGGGGYGALKIPAFRASLPDNLSFAANPWPKSQQKNYEVQITQQVAHMKTHNIYTYICNTQIISNTHIHLPVTLMNMSKIPETKKTFKKNESISILKSVFFVFFGPLLPFRAVLPGIQESKVINWNKVSMESSTSPKRIWSRRLDGPWMVGWW